MAGCSSDHDTAPEPEGIQAELFASTRKLEDADLAQLTESDDVGTLTFASEPAGLRRVEVGHVILAGMSPKTPAGLLRAVAAVDRDPSGKIVVRTVAAPLQVAFRKLHTRVRRSVQASDAADRPS